VIFIPAFIAPHKQHQRSSTPTQRLEMLKLAITNESGCTVSGIEIERGGVSYSIDTIYTFREKLHLERDNLYFLVGADSLVDFPNWRKPEEIFKVAQVIVARRPGYDLSAVRPGFLNQAHLLETPLMEISSATIRQAVQNGRDIHAWVKPAVAKYIHDNGLYRDTI